jgi:replicative DNA helicase
MSNNSHTNGYGNGQAAGRLLPEPNPAELNPPYNLNAEKWVLGACILDNDVIPDVVTITRLEDFWRELHQATFKIILDLWNGGKLVSAVMVEEELRRRGAVTEGTDAILFVGDLMDACGNTVRAIEYAQLVHEKAIRRSVIQGAQDVLQKANAGEVSADELLADAEKRFFSIGESSVSRPTIGVDEVMAQTLDAIKARKERKAVFGVPTGLHDLDFLLNGGLPNQALVIIAGRPSMGKTALALNICEYSASERKAPAMFVSLEMGKIEIGERLIASRARVDGSKIRMAHTLTPAEEAKVARAAYDLAGAPLAINDAPTWTVSQIAAEARRQKAKKKIAVLAVDYIQLIEAEPEDRRKASRQEQIATISRRLKTLAKELDIPVIALSQLNREVDHRDDHRPRMSDLRESGAIEQDADIIIFPFRPQHYNKEDQSTTATLIVEKQRGGSTGDVGVIFLKEFTRFENQAKDEYSNF